MNDSELINKQLTQELKRNAMYINELEGQVKVIEGRMDSCEKDVGYNNYLSQGGKGKNIENDQLFDDNEHSDKAAGTLQGIIENMKSQLKREKVKNSKILGEINKIMIDRNKLEKIFIDCVEESRKEIILRKNKENLYKTKSDFGKMPLISEKQNNDVKYENFLNTDKKRVIENFLLREDVINFLHDNLFAKGSELSEKDFGTTRSTFVKTSESKKRTTFYSNSNKKANGFSYNLPGTGTGRAKTPNINILFNK